MSLQGYNGWSKSLTGERNANFTILNLDTLNGNTINTSILNVSTLTSGNNACYINGYFSVLSCSTLNVSNALVDNVSGTSCSYINSSFTNSTIVNLSGTNATLSNISNVLFTSNTASITNSTLLNVSGTTCSYVNSSFTNSTITNCSALGITGTTCSYINISSTRISVINGSYERITSKYVNLSNCSLINASGTLLAFTNCFLINVSNNLLTSDTASITNSTLLNVSGTTCSYVNSSFTNSTIVNISNVLFTSDTASITNSTILSLSGTSCSYINSSFTNSTIVNLSNTGISSLYGDITTINTSVITGYNNKLILGYNSNLNVEISTEPLNDKTYIDFHSYNGSQNDYDARIYVSEPSFTTGQGKINLLGYTTNILSNDSGGFNVVLNNTSVLSCSVGKVYIPNLSNTNFSSDNSKITNVSGTKITATDVYFHNNILTNVSNTSLTSSKIDVTFVSSSYNTTVNTSNTSTTSAQIDVIYLTGTTSSFTNGSYTNCTIGNLVSPSVSITNSTLINISGTTCSYVNVSATNGTIANCSVTGITGTTVSFTNSSFTRTTIINNSMTRITAGTVSFTNATILNTSGTSCSYVNTSSTNFNAVTGEILNFNTSTVTCTSDHLALCLNSGKYLEIGTDSANLQYIDFHCLDNPAVPTDYDYRMICSNGSTTLGKGTMKLQGKQTYIEMDTGGDIYFSVGGTTYQAINAGGGNQFPQGVNLGNNINLTWYPNIYSYSTNGNALIHNCNVAGGVIKEQIQGSDIMQIDTNYITVNKPISIGYSSVPGATSNIGYTVVGSSNITGNQTIYSSSWTQVMSYTLPSKGVWDCKGYLKLYNLNGGQTTAIVKVSLATQSAPIYDCGVGWGLTSFVSNATNTPIVNPAHVQISVTTSNYTSAETLYMNVYIEQVGTPYWYISNYSRIVCTRIG